MDGYLGDELPVLKVYVGGGRHVVLPDAHPAFLGRPGTTQERRGGAERGGAERRRSRERRGAERGEEQREEEQQRGAERGEEQRE